MSLSADRALQWARLVSMASRDSNAFSPSFAVARRLWKEEAEETFSGMERALRRYADEGEVSVVATGVLHLIPVGLATLDVVARPFGFTVVDSQNDIPDPLKTAQELLATAYEQAVNKRLAPERSTELTRAAHTLRRHLQTSTQIAPKRA